MDEIPKIGDMSLGGGEAALHYPAAHRETQWALPLKWALVTAGGTIIGLFAAQALTGSVAISPIVDTQTLLTAAGTGTIMGSTVGLGQWLVIRRYLPNILLWIPATVFGWAVMGALTIYMEAVVGYYTVEHVPEPDLALTVIWDTTKSVMAGAAIGFPQWLVLRPRLSRTALWTPASAISSGISAGLVSIAFHGAGLLGEPGVHLFSRLAIPIVIILALSFIFEFAIFGIIQGFVLTWLLRHMREHPQE